MLTFPRDLIIAGLVDWSPERPFADGGETLGGVPRRNFMSAGPYWTLLLDDLLMRGRNQILAGNALQGALLGGTPILVRPCDCRQTPIVAGGSFGAAPASDGSPFDDALGSESAPIVATVAAAALRARSLTVTFTGSHRALVGGEHLSIDHAGWGRRMYLVEKVTGGTTNAPVVRITPPLRQAVTNGTAVDFNRPGCVMQMVGEMQINPTLPRRVHQGRVAFVELPRPIA